VVEKGEHFLAEGVAKMYGCKAAEKKEVWKDLQKR
jgi:hypothetical protein